VFAEHIQQIRFSSPRTEKAITEEHSASRAHLGITWNKYAPQLGHSSSQPADTIYFDIDDKIIL
jgi:hypothetical protein